MATFAQWVKGQLDRDDSIGYFAKYWDSASPGKISSISGVGKHLEQIKAEYETQPDGMAEPAWQRAQAAVAAALGGYHLAVTEYEKLENAAGNEEYRHAGITPGVPHPGRRKDAAPRPEPEQAGKYTGWPEERFDRLEANQGRMLELYERQMALIERLVAQNGELLALLRPPQPLDWHGLWETARADSAESAIREQRERQAG